MLRITPVTPACFGTTYDNNQKKEDKIKEKSKFQKELQKEKEKRINQSNKKGR